jgi:hypothetical protein
MLLALGGYPRLPSQHLFGTGALFSLGELVVIVRQLLHMGMFTLAAADWNGMEGKQLYLSAEAQDRLMYLLILTQLVGVQISNIMQQVIWWFDCLWAAEVTLLSVRQSMHSNPGMAAIIAPHWRRGGNGQALNVQTNLLQNPIWI